MLTLHCCGDVVVPRAKSTLATVKERIEEHKQERSRELQQHQQAADAPLQLAPLSQGLAARRSMALEGQAAAMAAAAAAAQQHQQQQMQQQQHAYQQHQQRRSMDMGSMDLHAKGSNLQSAAPVHLASSSTSSQPLAHAVSGDVAAASPDRHPPAAAVADSDSPCPEAPSAQPPAPGAFGSPPLDMLTSACTVERSPPSDAAGYGSGRPPGSAACSPDPRPDAQLLRQRHSTAEASTPSPAQPYPASDQGSPALDPYLPTAFTAPPGAGLGRGAAAGTASSPRDTRAAAVAAGSPGPGGIDPMSSDGVPLPGAASAPARGVGVGVSREGAGVASGGRGERDVDRGRGLAGEEEQVLELLREPLLRGDPREEVELSSRAVPVGGWWAKGAWGR